MHSEPVNSRVFVEIREVLPAIGRKPTYSHAAERVTGSAWCGRCEIGRGGASLGPLRNGRRALHAVDLLGVVYTSRAAETALGV